MTGWRLFARATRHLLRIAEDDGDARLPLIRQLYSQIVVYADRTAARAAARAGGDDGDSAKS